MSLAPHFLTVDAAYTNQRLDNFLLTRLKGLPKTCLYRLIRQGKIRVNKKRCRPSDRVKGEDLIRLPRLTLSEASTQAYPSNSLQQHLLKSILFENEAFIIINKPYGLAVHGGSGLSLGLIESLRQMFPQLPHLSLAHRLDRDTSGCLLIAKKPAALKSLHVLFRAKEIEKTYLMLTQGHWPRTLTMIDKPLMKNRLQSGERMVHIHTEGQTALTHYKIREYFQNTSLVEAKLHTGRTHQIRVHAQYAKHPIAGDEKYGDKAFNQIMRQKKLKRLFLHACQLKFTCPQTLVHIDVKAPLPMDLKASLSEDI